MTVAKTSDNASGVLACLRKSDGSKAWEDSSSYAWSSPVCVYNKDGSGKVLYCNSTGDIRLLDGKTGKQKDVLSVSEGVIEASPAVYDNYAVVGTREVLRLVNPVSPTYPEPAARGEGFELLHLLIDQLLFLLCEGAHLC